MGRKLLLFVIILLLGAGSIRAQGAAAAAPKIPGMALTSPDFKDGGIIPVEFTQQAGEKAKSPELDWSNVPANTRSFALIVHDPDNALNKGTTDVLHWMVVNIPGAARSLQQGFPKDAKLPDGTMNMKGIRMVGYMGPGNQGFNPYHHYLFELYALDAPLNVAPDATREDVLAAMQGHTTGKAAMVGMFKRTD